MRQELDTINEIFQANYRRGSAYKHMPAFENFDFDEVMKFMKLAYNQAIQDSVKSLQNYEMIWGNGAIVPSNQFEREILKLKIK